MAEHYKHLQNVLDDLFVYLSVVSLVICEYGGSNVEICFVFQHRGGCTWGNQIKHELIQHVGLQEVIRTVQEQSVTIIMDARL